MVRSGLAVLAAIVAWLVFATICGLGLRVTWPAYVAAEPVFAFTLPMLCARLAIGALATVLAGWVAARVSGGGGRTVLAQGLVLLILFVPQHITLFDKFPLWYHGLFLFSLVPLTLLGGANARVVGRSATGRRPAT